MDARLASLVLILITFCDCVSSVILGKPFFLGINSYGSSDRPAGVWLQIPFVVVPRLFFCCFVFIFSARDRTGECLSAHG